MTKHPPLQHLLEPPRSDHQATFGWHFFALSKLRKTAYLK